MPNNYFGCGRVTLKLFYGSTGADSPQTGAFVGDECEMVKLGVIISHTMNEFY